MISVLFTATRVLKVIPTVEVPNATGICAPCATSCITQQSFRIAEHAVAPAPHDTG